MPAARTDTVVVMGLGFVGAAMAVAIAAAKKPDGTARFHVIGLDLPTEEGRRRADSIAGGAFPFGCQDNSLISETAAAARRGNLVAATDPAVIGDAAVVVVDVNLDVDIAAAAPSVDYAAFRRAIAQIGAHAAPDTLVVVETTVPPGTCERIVVPELARALERRGMDPGQVFVAHSFERVMPGADYLDSIRNYWRVYAGIDDGAAEKCREFLEAIIDTERYPLCRLASTTASELAKVVENSYRAVNIAFVEEWSRLAERIGVDFFSVAEAIRVRPTHSNIRQPGFGVGGYCLTKDPLMGHVSARQLYGEAGLDFPFSSAAVAINKDMPIQTLNRVRAAIGGDLRAKRILLLGVAYRQDVADTRHSPSETFLRAAEADGAVVVAHDPHVEYWAETGRPVAQVLPEPTGFDAVVFAVPHGCYRGLDVCSWLGSARPYVFDANAVLDAAQWAGLAALQVPSGSIGRGAGRSS